MCSSLSPDCLLVVVPQPTDSRLSETTLAVNNMFEDFVWCD